MRSRLTGLWRHPEFMKLWAGQTVSVFGSVITRDALPLAAILVLAATPAQMGLLVAATTAPVILLGLQAGVWVDRLRRRPVMIATDLARAALLLWIPVAALLGVLRIEHLYVVAAGVGLLSVFFDVAYRAFLPTLVTRAHIVEGNSKLSLSESLAESLGPAVAGLLVQLITAPLALLVDALTFLWSALCLALIRTPEPAPPPTEQGAGMRREIVAGLRTVGGTPVLRSLLGAAATSVFFGGFIGPLYGLFAIRELGLSPALLGFVIATGGIGGLAGAALAESTARRWGLGRTLLLTTLLGAGATALIPLASGPVVVAAAVLIAGQILGDGLMTIYGIHALSLQQAVTPDRVLGRVNASEAFLVAVVGLLGALGGGALGGALGLRATLMLAAAGKGLALLWLLAPEVRTLRGQPEPLLEAVGGSSL